VIPLQLFSIIIFDFIIDVTGNHNIGQFTECNLSVSELQAEVKKELCTLPNLRMLRKMEAMTSKSQK
jgi:hypothetical protein